MNRDICFSGLIQTHMTQVHRDLARILRPLYTFVEQISFKIMNKQEYNELNLIISYVALLISNGD